MSTRRLVGSITLGLALAHPLAGQDAKDFVREHVDARSAHYGTVAQSIWELAEQSAGELLDPRGVYVQAVLGR